ncbi:MAG: class I SAM-dependent methyltransferase [Bacteroidales bacterium]|nr:class I SAM-dependent methyltransferase [Bacteroidales bacterium]MBN2817706.1 class I SAM-dependent methyltransferase [Bacteroidales bacterium]
MNTFEISVKRFDEFASEYAARFMNVDSYHEHFDKFCTLFECKNPSILELACGSGNVTKYIRQRFPDSDIIALDLAPGMIEIAKNTVAGVDFRVMNVGNLKSIDIIIIAKKN